MEKCKFWSNETERCIKEEYFGYKKCRGDINKCKGITSL